MAGLLAVAVAVSPTHTAAAGSPGPATPPTGTPYLPAPTGPHPVGITSLHLTDESRQDPWVPRAGPRELMVSLWYPAKSRGERRVQYMTPKESELLLKGHQITSVPYDSFSKPRTNAYTDVQPVGGRHPLVLLSPGFTWYRTSLSALAEELASRGYVVASIDHTYENFATTFPDGRVITCATCNGEIEDFDKLVVDSRARDVSFVLDELLGRRGTLIDPSRIAMAGMSIGGASVGETMLTDPRVLAGANLDGTMFKPLAESGLSRPFMFFTQNADDATLNRDWRRLTGWKRWLKVTGAVHASFADHDTLSQQMGLDFGSKLAGTRSVEITRAYVAAFFDRHLRNRPQPLLERPSRHYPEVGFCTPEQKPCH
ncbi:hypothetical protein AOZ06_25430 [Kibdelosporangium phytohabitans]|uniref:Acetylhydrolase n=1 Tax=Kibdelosporangium phytohabitans TaxID=860235 RepID=A0A0N9IEX5_9PSEU|nr:hypothetical protein AOZ06_25430 [Kibdelosporangium phytohabitans]